MNSMDIIDFDFFVDIICDADSSQTSILAKHFRVKFTLADALNKYAECVYRRGLVLGWGEV